MLLRVPVSGACACNCCDKKLPPQAWRVSAFGYAQLVQCLLAWSIAQQRCLRRVSWRSPGYVEGLLLLFGVMAGRNYRLFYPPWSNLPLKGDMLPVWIGYIDLAPTVSGVQLFRTKLCWIALISATCGFSDFVSLCWHQQIQFKALRHISVFLRFFHQHCCLLTYLAPKSSTIYLNSIGLPGEFVKLRFIPN